jgi:hypothetical protein
MPRDGHKSRAGRPTGGRDRRTTDLVDHSHGHNLISQSNKQLALDPHRGMLLEWMAHGNRRGLQTGVVLYSLPHAHWYKVQLDGVSAQIGCTTAENAGHTPVGVRRVGSLPARSHVVVWVPPGRTYGLIIACYPVANQDPRLVVPDWSVQGGQAGIKREDAYKLPIKTAYRQGHILDFSAGRPIDSLSNEWGLITETGIEFLMDSWQTFLRVNEMCGLFLNYFDSHTRLAGIQMDLQSAVHEVIARLDEGENRLVTAESTYPWEALGLYTNGTQLHNVFDDTKVQYSIAKGTYDLPDGEDDVQTIARWQEHGGYLGQGKLRTLMIPNPKGSGKRHYSDSAKKTPDVGVFRESVALDGSWTVESAKQLLLVKRTLIPVAKEMLLPEDQTGDDARLDNYKFSGTFGGGTAHKVGDVKLNDTNKHLLSTSGIDDLIAYATNWKAVHPFHYHQKDYQLPEESDIANAGGPQRVQDVLDFGELSSSMYMSYPQPRTVKVDSRYSDVEYFERESGVALLPDGGIMIFDGYGAAIVLTAGNIRFECPGNVFNLPGRSAITMAGRDIVERAYRSVDITANQHDVRIKAERNLMMLGGNETEGGILLESKAPGFLVDFEGKIGEDVLMGGIILKSAHAGIVCWGGDIYLRTGGGDNDTGVIALDADQGSNQIVCNGETIDLFAVSSVNCWLGSTTTVTATYNFTSSGAIIDKEMVCGGPAVFLGAVAVQGAVAATEGFAAGQGSPFVAPLNNNDVAQAFSQANKAIQDERKAGTTDYKEVFTQFLYAKNEPGNDDVIKQAEFGYRDKDEQYGTTQFQLPESRWQMMSRLGLGTGGTGWVENPVSYQGTDQLPWPGKENWQGKTLLEMESFSMFDVSKGLSKDRAGGPYESPQVSGFTPGSPQSDFKVIDES